MKEEKESTYAYVGSIEEARQKRVNTDLAATIALLRSEVADLRRSQDEDRLTSAANTTINEAQLERAVTKSNDAPTTFGTNPTTVMIPDPSIWEGEFPLRWYTIAGCVCSICQEPIGYDRYAKRDGPNNWVHCPEPLGCRGR